MRSCLFLGVLAALLTFAPTVSTAQSDMLGTARPVRGVSRPAEAPPEAAMPSAMPRAGGMTVSKDTKLTAGDEITVLIKEDHDPALRTIVTDTGEVELAGMGRVSVSGRSSMEAEALIATFLKQRYYHHATVEVGIVRKAIGTVRPYKVVVTGKVNRAGPQFFTSSNPLKLAEAVTVAGIGTYSEIRKVNLSRGGRKTEHDLRAITKEGRTDLDVILQDGDQIYVPTIGVRFFGEQ